jgi:hypothetical protein
MIPGAPGPIRRRLEPALALSHPDHQQRVLTQLDERRQREPDLLAVFLA